MGQRASTSPFFLLAVSLALAGCQASPPLPVGAEGSPLFASLRLVVDT